MPGGGPVGSYEVGLLSHSQPKTWRIQAQHPHPWPRKRTAPPEGGGSGCVVYQCPDDDGGCVLFFWRDSCIFKVQPRRGREWAMVDKNAKPKEEEGSSFHKRERREETRCSTFEAASTTVYP